MSKSQKRAPRTRTRTPRSKKADVVNFRGSRSRKRTRPTEVTFPELGDLKDRIAMNHAKTYADEMFNSEEALVRATAAKQAIRARMEKLDSTHFTGHGYEFSRTPGEEKFSARKVKRGSKPADTMPADEAPDAGEAEGEVDYPAQDE